MGHKRVLLTGFEPFSDLAINESSEIVDIISNVELENIEIITKILSVDQRGTIESLDILKNTKFKFKYHL